MRKIIQVLFPASLLFVQAVTAQEGPLDLQACFELSKKQSESLRIESEDIALQEARHREAVGGVLPRVNFLFTETFQDTSGVEDRGGDNNTSTRRERPDARFRLRQPLFTGFREFSAMSSLKAATRRERLDYQRAVKLLFLDVARSFYVVVLLENDVKDIQGILQLTQERVRELQERIRLGKSRRSELLSLEAQIAVLKAEEDNVQGNIAVARETLSFLTGQNLEERVLTDAMPTPKKVGPQASYVVRVASRTDVAAQAENVESFRQDVRIARGALWPSADVTGNYYVKRVGSQEPVDWDVIFGLDVPLYQGGSAAARVRQAKTQLRQAELSLVRLQRNAETEIKTAHATLERSLARVRNLEDAFKKVAQSYRLQVQEYRLGLVNNLDVLAALRALSDNRRDLDRARYQSKLDYLQLQVAAELIP